MKKRSASPNRMAVDLTPTPEVVLAIDHRVHGVVDDGPGHHAGEQQPRERRHRAGERGERHRDPPPEGDPEMDLRQVGPPLHERVARGEHGTGEGVQHGEPVQREHQCERDQAQGGEQPERLARPDLAARDGPVHRAAHVRIHPAVREVVDDAAGRAHHEHPDHEHRHHRCIGLALAGDPQRPQRRPQQQQGPDRLVHARQQRVLDDAVLQVRNQRHVSFESPRHVCHHLTP